MRKEVIIPGIGWIASGIVSICTWLVRAGSSSNMLYIGILVILVGISLFLLNGRIGKIIDAHKTRNRGRGL